jgi:hypothetical protein
MLSVQVKRCAVRTKCYPCGKTAKPCNPINFRTPEEEYKMKDKERRINETGIRVSDFFASRQAAFAHNAVASAKITSLGQKLANLTHRHKAKIAGGGTSKQKTSMSDTHFDELKDVMRDIVNFATSMARDINGLENKFRMPRSSGKRNLIAAARVFAVDAQTFQTDFKNYGMPGGFIENLTAKANDLEQTISDSNLAKETRVGATGELGSQSKDIVDLVRQLDPIVRMVYRNDAANLAAWTFAGHIQRIGNLAVHKAQAENRRLGLPNVYSRNGKIIFEMPNGEVIVKNNEVK